MQIIITFMVFYFYDWAVKAGLFGLIRAEGCA